MTNQKGSVISEVAQSYTIKLEVEGSMPITFEITEQGSKDDWLCRVENIGESHREQDTSSAIELSTAADTRIYKLTAFWPEEENDAKYANASGTGAVTLTIDAQQLD